MRAAGLRRSHAGPMDLALCHLPPAAEGGCEPSAPGLGMPPMDIPFQALPLSSSPNGSRTAPAGEGRGACILHSYQYQEKSSALLEARTPPVQLEFCGSPFLAHLMVARGGRAVKDGFAAAKSGAPKGASLTAHPPRASSL